MEGEGRTWSHGRLTAEEQQALSIHPPTHHPQKIQGDNIYEEGVTSVDDPLWDSRYCNVYTDPTLLDVPWYAILGNHDYYAGGEEFQIEYYVQKLDPAQRWYMPSHYYSNIWPDVGGGQSMQILFLDTVQLADETFRRALRHDGPAEALAFYGEEVEEEAMSGGVRGGKEEGETRRRQLRKIRIEERETKKAAQLAWLEKTLAESTADWLLVAGHFPMYSGGYHGDTEELQRDVRPLLEKYRVDAYLCGHDHDLQYLRDAPEGQGVAYFASGSGGQDVYPLHFTKEVCTTVALHPRQTTPTHPTPPTHPTQPTPPKQKTQTVFAVEESGFMSHKFSTNGKQMTVEIINRDGKVLFTETLKQRRTGGITEVKHA